MKETDVQSILVIGTDAAALATSAKKAGYNVFAANYFGDQDLKKVCNDSLSIVVQEVGKSYGRFEANFSPSTFLDLAKRLLAKHRIDAALLASSLENYPLVLTELNQLLPIIGNRPRTIEKVYNKIEFFHKLKKLAINYPQTALAKNLEEGRRAAKDIGYPVIVKPWASLGGVRIRKVKDRTELDRVFQQVSSSSPRVLIQEFVSGIDTSVSFLSSGKATVVLTLNEQLIGIQEIGQKEPFGYCGNIVPASTNSALVDVCSDIVQKIALHFGLVGSNGVDLIISKNNVPYVVEVNPRFQGTLECVERLLGINLVHAHMKACIEGVLPSLKKRNSSISCVRLILCARQRSIAPSLSYLDEVRDIPLPGVIIEDGEPLCSIVVEEKTRSSALKKSRMLANNVYRNTKSKLQ